MTHAAERYQDLGKNETLSRARYELERVQAIIRSAPDAVYFPDHLIKDIEAPTELQKENDEYLTMQGYMEHLLGRLVARSIDLSQKEKLAIWRRADMIASAAAFYEAANLPRERAYGLFAETTRRSRATMLATLARLVPPSHRTQGQKPIQWYEELYAFARTRLDPPLQDHQVPTSKAQWQALSALMCELIEEYEHAPREALYSDMHTARSNAGTAPPPIGTREEVHLAAGKKRITHTITDAYIDTNGRAYLTLPSGVQTRLNLDKLAKQAGIRSGLRFRLVLEAIDEDTHADEYGQADEEEVGQEEDDSETYRF